MSKTDKPDPVRTALAVSHAVATVTGLDLPVPGFAYRRRSAEHIAEVARLSRDHAAMIAGMDRFAESRATGYDDKSTEVFMDTRDVSQAMIAVSPVNAKQNKEETNERS